MRYLKYFALLAVLMVPLAYSQAEVRVGVGVGVGPGYFEGPPVCEYGYYDSYPMLAHRTDITVRSGLAAEYL